MSDIVERLRDWMTVDQTTTPASRMAEAAHEIESLRATLDGLKPDPRCDASCMFSCHGEAKYLIESLRQQLAECQALLTPQVINNV